MAKEEAVARTQSSDEAPLDVTERRALETEIAALRERLHQREAALTVLNRRLVVLERFDAASALGAPVPADAEIRARAAEEELARVMQTRTFRWTAGARRVYGLIRRLGGT